MTAPTKEMQAVAEHLRKHCNPTDEVVKAAQAVADHAATHPEAQGECPSLSPEGLALELERRAGDEPGHFEWPHVGANLRRMVPGLKEAAKKDSPPAAPAAAKAPPAEEVGRFRKSEK